MVVVVGEGSRCFHHNHCPKIHLCDLVLFYDAYGTFFDMHTVGTCSYISIFKLNFWSFAIMFALSAVALNYWIRFRYLNTYAKLKEPPLPKADAQELHPDVNTPEQMPAFHNYLDEFLQAVRVFGFLEKPVS